MKALLKGKSGVTILEGVIALGLLALVTAGAFGVLLSASRQSSLPDMREEMLYAVEQASEKLQVYVEAAQTGETGRSYLPEEFKCGLCGHVNASGGCTSDASYGFLTDNAPLGAGTHTITCMLPPSCDRNNGSSFSYTVSNTDEVAARLVSDDMEGVGTWTHGEDYDMATPVFSGKRITFTIRCNGYEL